MKIKPKFLITIDTEGDNLWSKPNKITTNNAKYLPQFQKLCEKYCFKPTYLVNYEMANSSTFIKLAKNWLNNKTCEIGMHLHAWNTPPKYNLTENDLKNHPYLTEYPSEIIFIKINIMTNLLEDIFQQKIQSHRAGRWAFNETYAKILIENGYKVDCSVTPYISWQSQAGDPNNKGGTDYSLFYDEAYFINMSDISLKGNSNLLEIPVTITNKPKFICNIKRTKINKIKIFRKIMNRIFPAIWLRPNGKNINKMLYILNKKNQNKAEYVEFIIHSSELMPGGSPTFKTNDSIEKLYNDLEILFLEASKYFQGATLSEFYQLKTINNAK